MNFTYLGIDISSDGPTYREEAWKDLEYLDILEIPNLYSLEGKVKIYKTMVRPVLTYRAETPADTSRT